MINISRIQGRLIPALFILLISLPVRAQFETKDYVILSSAAAAGLILYNNDAGINRKFMSHQNSFSDHLSAGAEVFGNKYVLGAGFIGLFAFSAYTGNVELKNTSILAFKSFAVTGVVTYSLKALIHRHRPSETSDPYKFSGPSFKTDNLSFPSGHTAFAFSTAKIFSDSYEKIKFLPYITYSAAALTGLSRIYDGEHWASDVLAGAVIGYYSAYLILKTNRSDKILILPDIAPGRTGLYLGVSF